MADVTFISGAHNIDSWGVAAPDIPVDKPAGAQEGHLLLYWFYRHNFSDSAVVTPPSGFVEIYRGSHVGLYYKVATANEPASYTFTCNEASNRSGINALLAFDNVDASIFDVPFNSNNHLTIADAIDSVEIPAITTTTNGALVISFVSTRNTGTLAYTYPAGFASLYENLQSSARAVGVSAKKVMTAGLESPANLTVSQTTSKARAITIALKPNDSIVIDNITVEPASSQDWVAFSGGVIPTESILFHESSAHTAADNVQLVDDTRSWTVDELVGLRVLNTVSGATGIITANTSSAITATMSGGSYQNFKTGDTYVIETALETDDQIVYDKKTNLDGDVVVNDLGVATITGVQGDHAFNVKFRDTTDSKVSSTNQVTVEVV